MRFALYFLLGVTLPAFAWDGYDYDKDTFIEIDKGNLVRPGRDIEIFDYNSGQYKDVEVQSIQSHGSNTEVEIYDHDSGEYRTLEMDSE
jgi:hypothetical protein